MKYKDFEYEYLPDNTIEITRYVGEDENVVIPSEINGIDVTSIGLDAFREHYYLTNVEIPYGIKTIGAYAFDNCIRLPSITIPDSVTEIGSSAFYNCESLRNVSLSENITSIELYTFYIVALFRI